MADRETTRLPVWGDPSARGAVHYSDDAGREWLWSRCHVPACPHCVCVRLSDRFCWPHAGNDAADLIPAAKEPADA